MIQLRQTWLRSRIDVRRYVRLIREGELRAEMRLTGGV